MTSSWQLFAHQRPDGLFEHFHPSTIQVRLCGNQENVFLVRLELDDENGEYWGWYHSETSRVFADRVSMVYRNRLAVEVCFPYGTQAETKRGRGRVVRLRVTPVRPAVHPEGIR